MIKTAIILCGGRGRRLGILGEKSPKTMSNVHGYPIIWYTILNLYKSGIRHFILPLGYKGEQIQAYIDKNFSLLNARIDAIFTGVDVPIGKRLFMVKHLIPKGGFLMVNGDCLFDFSMENFFQKHIDKKYLATLATCQIKSQYGLILVRNNKVLSFSRDSIIKSFFVSDKYKQEYHGYVNAGITLLDLESLDLINLLDTHNFENDLFPILIKEKRVGFEPIDNFWFAIETQKDLDIANGLDVNNMIFKNILSLKDKMLKIQAKLDLRI